jgi:hypothetical protein
VEVHRVFTPVAPDLGDQDIAFLQAELFRLRPNRGKTAVVLQGQLAEELQRFLVGDLDLAQQARLTLGIITI